MPDSKTLGQQQGNIKLLIFSTAALSKTKQAQLLLTLGSLQDRKTGRYFAWRQNTLAMSSSHTLRSTDTAAQQMALRLRCRQCSALPA